ncbi:hypothetical protein AC249_AIPGENE13959 [Exaiptasia diaphana]|nr:hypothetical protein AC249_AIPGENE13959 [Exaiptasia diaphana]
MLFNRNTSDRKLRQQQRQVPARQDSSLHDVPVVPETRERSRHGQQQQGSIRQDASLHEVPEVTDAETPIHPGGPPPYHSLERLDRIEEPPPPTYEEALRNSQEIEITV